MVIKQAIPILLVLCLTPLILRQLDDIDFTEALSALARLAPWQWLAAAVATAVSYWAIGRYDCVTHTLLRTNVPRPAAHRAGIAAISTSQFTGFSLLVGTLARWRMLPGLSLAQVIAVAAMGSVLFFVGWGFLTGVALLTLPNDLPYANGIGALVVLAALGLVAVSLFVRPSRFGALKPPSLSVIGAVAVIATLDLGTAALAFWLLLPPESVLAFWMILPAYLLAFTAGILGGTPAGVGPFELALFALLPAAPTTELVAALMAFRLIYYLAPACLGAALLAIGPRQASSLETGTTLTEPRKKSHTAVEDLFRRAAQAEFKLRQQVPFRVLVTKAGTCAWMVRETGQTLTAIFAPLGTESRHSALAHLRQAAEQIGRIPCLYKCDKALAVTARAAGYRVLKVSHEAVLNPSRFSTAGSVRRQLRRKLRHAEASGVTVTAEVGPMPDLLAQDLHRIDTTWQRRSGPARGFSMGRFERGYIAGQRRYLARHGGQVVAFATFHTSRSEWVLDLMRHTETSPDGTMHALICAALQDAKHRGMDRLSLAAIPASISDELPPALTSLAQRWDRASGRAGLLQFKTCFAPVLEPRYMAAPSRLGLALAAFDLAREITRPAPVVPVQSAKETMRTTDAAEPVSSPKHSERAA